MDLLRLHLPHNKKIQEATERMKDAASQLSDLTNQLIAYGRGGVYQPEQLSLSDFVQEMLPGIQREIKNDIVIEKHLVRDTRDVMVDFSQMQLVLHAVITNAVEAIEGAGQVRIFVRNEVVTDDFAESYTGFKTGHYVCLIVEDTGKGMDSETAQEVFNPFFSTKGQGRGLSMAAVYEIIKNHNGYVYVDSEPEQGTFVSIYLPAMISS